MESTDFLCAVLPDGSFLPGSMRLSNLRALYPPIEDIFEKHVKDAKFDRVPMKSRDFRDLKLGVISLRHLFDEHEGLRQETRSALFQALVIERSFQQAFKLLPKKSNAITRWFSSFWSDKSEEESFRYEMRRAAAHVSASQFLQQLESADSEDLLFVAQNAKTLAQTELSSSIDTVATSMTHDVLVMQQDLCEGQVQLQVAKEEREVLKNALVEFIREINNKSAKGQNS